MKILPAALLLLAPAYTVSVKSQMRTFLAQQYDDYDAEAYVKDDIYDLKYEVMGGDYDDHYQPDYEEPEYHEEPYEEPAYHEEEYDTYEE